MKVHYRADSSPPGLLFLGAVLLAFLQTPRTVDRPLSAVSIFSSSPLSAIWTRHDVVARSPTVRDWAVHLRKKFKNTLSLLTHELTVLNDHWILTLALAHVFSIYHTMSTRSSSINKLCSCRSLRAFPQHLGPQNWIPNRNIALRNYKVRHLRPIIQ